MLPELTEQAVDFCALNLLVAYLNAVLENRLNCQSA